MQARRLAKYLCNGAEIRRDRWSEKLRAGNPGRIYVKSCILKWHFLGLAFAVMIANYL